MYFGDSRACPFGLQSHEPKRQFYVFHLMHGKILAESFQFDWKESIFYKLDKYIQPDCIMTNQPSQTELSKCHDREERSFTQL